jgi:hypothetical protein
VFHTAANVGAPVEPLRCAPAGARRPLREPDAAAKRLRLMAQQRDRGPAVGGDRGAAHVDAGRRVAERGRRREGAAGRAQRGLRGRAKRAPARHGVAATVDGERDGARGRGPADRLHRRGGAARRHGRRPDWVVGAEDELAPRHCRRPGIVDPHAELPDHHGGRDRDRGAERAPRRPQGDAHLRLVGPGQGRPAARVGRQRGQRIAREAAIERLRRAERAAQRPRRRPHGEVGRARGAPASHDAVVLPRRGDLPAGNAHGDRLGRARRGRDEHRLRPRGGVRAAGARQGKRRRHRRESHGPHALCNGRIAGELLECAA